MGATVRRRIRDLTALAAVSAGLGLATAGEAPALERVVDGGFDASSCDNAGCSSTVWDEDSDANVGTSPIGPICSGMNLGCASNASGFSTAPNWARLGAATAAGGGAFQVTTAVEQVISIPAAPATLTFYLRFLDLDPTGLSQMKVSLSGTVLRTFTQPTGFATYVPVTIDVGAFAGGTRVLRFEGASFFGGIDADSYDIDRVSLDAPDAAPAPTLTGQRDAALKRCKKKKRKKARRKCRKRARALPA
jgi:hypothetical protein